MIGLAIRCCLSTVAAVAVVDLLQPDVAVHVTTSFVGFYASRGDFLTAWSIAAPSTDEFPSLRSLSLTVVNGEKSFSGDGNVDELV